jgi:hypothetical protein
MSTAGSRQVGISPEGGRTGQVEEHFHPAQETLSNCRVQGYFHEGLLLIVITPDAAHLPILKFQPCSISIRDETDLPDLFEYPSKTMHRIRFRPGLPEGANR